MNAVALGMAAAMSLAAFCVHTFVGGRYAARPLLAAIGTLPRATVWLNYLTWQVVTVLLAVLAAGFLAAALGANHRDAALLSAVIAGAISLVSVAVTARAGIAFWRFPASYLLGTAAAAGFIGSLA